MISPLSSQNQVGVNTSTVDASAVFEILHSSKGLLIPRMTSGQRNAIPSPANGLLVYETNSRSFWNYNNGWIQIIFNNNDQTGLGDSDGDIRILTEFTTDNDQIRFYQQGTEYFRMNRKRLEVVNNGNSIFLGDSAGFMDNKTNNLNVFVGTRSGKETVNGVRNVAIGYESLLSNINQSDVVAIGYSAGRGFESVRRSVVIGSNNTALNTTQDFMTTIGHDIMPSHTARNNNAAIGVFALGSSTNTRSNIVVGNQSLSQNVSGGFNVALGYKAGESCLNGTSIFIGNRAGELNTAGNRLFIDNNNTTSPLLWGNFFLDSLVINGDLHVSNNITYVGNLTDASDRRLKENISPIQNQLPKLTQLQGYKYHLISSIKPKKEYGLVAQEVQPIFPSIVKKIDSKGHIGVSYVQLIPILIEGEKEQFQMLKQTQTAIDQLDLEIRKLEEEINKLKESHKSNTSSSL